MLTGLLLNCTTFCQIDSLYLGLMPPGTSPEIFGVEEDQGYFACDRIAISSDGKEIYYSETTGNDWSNCKIKRYTFTEQVWNGPELIYTGPYFAPGLSLNDSVFYTEQFVPEQSYHSSRTASGWGTLIQYPNYRHYYQITTGGTAYAGINHKISVEKIIGTDTTFKSLGAPVNSGTAGGFSVARDESFMIFTSNRGGSGGNDLFISYRKSDSTWTNPKNLGETINSSSDDYGAYISGDNKYLFFSRCNLSYNDGNLYWVNIEDLVTDLKLSNFLPYVKNSVPNQTAIINNLFQYEIPDSVFYDDDGNGTLSINVETVLPEWLDYDEDTKTFSGIPLELGSLNVTISATDTAGASVSDVFKITTINPEALQLKSTNGVVIYPNPAENTLIISSELNFPDDINYSFYGVDGRIILKGTTRLNTPIDIAGLGKGIWNLQVEIQGEISTHKIMHY